MGWADTFYRMCFGRCLLFPALSCKWLMSIDFYEAQQTHTKKKTDKKKKNLHASILAIT